MSCEYPDKIVLAYVQSKDTDYLLITLALYDPANQQWLDMMRDKDLLSHINVVSWHHLPSVPEGFELFNCLKSHQYRTIYKNAVKDNSQ